MQFDILTVIPESLDSYLNASILARAESKQLIEVNVHNIRDYAEDAHRTVDDRPYGGGAGMVMKVDILAKALAAVMPRRSKKTRVILLNSQGQKFNQKKAEELFTNYDRLVLVCGRYEGFDARAELLVDEELSIGDYILTGGELPALVVLDAVSRLVPGVVGKTESVLDESFSEANPGLEYPHYTRPEVFVWKRKKYAVPEVLLSGDHKKIDDWRRKESDKRTRERRPDLIEKKE